MSHRFISALILGTASLTTTLLASNSLAQDRLEEMVVTADFYESSALEIASSVTILDQTSIQQRSAEHLEQLLALAPNVNYASGASRGRFIQIRGIGERSEFIEPVNYSVGVLIDGIDFTGISTAASTLDIQQVEILRGPQGTLYGANALAGLINMVSVDPTETTEAMVEASLGNYNSKVLKGGIGGALSDQLGYRVAAQSTQSDGFISNNYLGRDDTNHIDEKTLRGKLAYAASDELNLGLSAFFADVDNGYDVFNYESLRATRSNEPGHDRQETRAFALSADWQLNDDLSLEANLSRADSDIEYSFDEDWRNPELCIVESCLFGADGYHTAFDNYQRDNQNSSLDLRLKSSNADLDASWVLGIYSREQTIDLTQTYSYSGFDSVFNSAYDTSNRALYGDWSQSISDRLKFSVGARFEKRQADYLDSDLYGFSTSESLWGGKLSLSYQLQASKMLYATISRGYKPGGANSNSSVPTELREYDTETMLNYELGLKGSFLDDRLEAQIAIFYQDRDDIQTDSAIVDCSSLPCSFDDYLTNAAGGSNLGLETQISYALSDSTELYTSLGILSAEYGAGYINYQHVNADEDNGIGVDMDGRDQPHAPSYQFVVGINTLVSESLSLHLNLEGKDDFLFSNDHDVRSSSYVLLNTDLTYSSDNWSATLWGKNLNDQDYQTRAFGSFGNDPRDGYVTNAYYQLGDPRTFGVTGRYNF